MADTVRMRIEQAVIAALTAIPKVTVAGLVDGSQEAAAGQITEQAGDGQWVVEVYFGDDEIADGDMQRLAGIDQWTFPVALLVHLPVSGETGRDERTLRSEVAKAIAPAFVSRGVAWGVEGGDPAKGPGWGGLAIRTMPLGGGGQAQTEQGTAAVVLGFEIEYRHRRGDPTAA